MDTNFDFLKKYDKNLYTIAIDAEKLYRDEYFDQCITQTRRLGENLCRKVLGTLTDYNDTFDNMLATLKDKSNGSEREKEFIDDLYFLKKRGNETVHSIKTKENGIIALECLQRSFEACINYVLSEDKSRNDLLSLRYDEELLILGTHKKQSLKEKYLEEKARAERVKQLNNDKKDEKQTSKIYTPKNNLKKHGSSNKITKTAIKTSDKKNTSSTKKKKKGPQQKTIKPLNNKKSPKTKNSALKKLLSLFWKTISIMAMLGILLGLLILK